MPTDITANSKNNTPPKSGFPEELFDKGCSIMRKGEYNKAIEIFNEADAKRGETTPDTLRNMGWCHYRLGEDSLFSAEHDQSLKLFSRAREYYRQAENGFLKLLKERQSPELKKRIESRIQDCQYRVGGIRNFGEFMHRKHEFLVEQRENIQAAETKLPKDEKIKNNMRPVSVRVAPPQVS